MHLSEVVLLKYITVFEKKLSVHLTFILEKYRASQKEKKNFSTTNSSTKFSLNQHQSFMIVYLSNQLVNIFLAGPNSSN